MRLFRLFVILLLSASGVAAGKDVPLQIRLVAENRTLAPGEPFRLGLHLVHPPGTHTYWKHPGIVGLPTTVKWELPEGFAAGEIHWPAPQVVKMGSYDAQGYEGETLLIIPVTAPPILSSSEVTLRAKVSWMCCGKTCSPANQVPLTLTLAVGKASEPDPSVEPLFKKFDSEIPMIPTGWGKISPTRTGGKIVLTLEPPFREKDPYLTPESQLRFFTADGQVTSDAEQNTEISPQGIAVMTLPVSEFGPAAVPTLPGVLVITTGKKRYLLEINPAYGL